MNNYNLGYHLENYIITNKVKKKDLSNIFGVSINTIDSWLKNEKKPELDRLCMLSMLLGISVDEMINGDKNLLKTEMSYANYIENRGKRRISNLSKLPNHIISRILSDYLDNYNSLLLDMKNDVDSKIDIEDFKSKYEKRWLKMRIEFYSKSVVFFTIKKDKDFDFNSLDDENKQYYEFSDILFDNDVDIDFLLKNAEKHKNIQDKNGKNAIFGTLKINSNDTFNYLCEIISVLKSMNKESGICILNIIKKYMIFNREIEKLFVNNDCFSSYLIKYYDIVGKYQIRDMILQISNTSFLKLGREKNKEIYKYVYDVDFDKSQFDELLKNEYNVKGKIKLEVLYEAYLRDVDIFDLINVKDFCKALYERNEYVSLEY